MPLLPQLSDDALTDVVSRFAGLAAVVLRDPERWLGWGESDETDSLPARVGAAAGHLVLGGTSPGSPEWGGLPVADRAHWWVARISNLAGFLAASPRVLGAAADRLPIQAALGASVQGLAVCAVAREHGVGHPEDWVPLLGQVVFDRRLERGEAAAGVDAALLEADEADDEDDEDDSAGATTTEQARRPMRRARRTTWRLARTFLAAQGMFDERPRGAFVFRALGKVPVVGLLGGWLDERGGVRKAAEQTVRALAR